MTFSSKLVPGCLIVILLALLSGGCANAYQQPAARATGSGAAATLTPTWPAAVFPTLTEEPAGSPAQEAAPTPTTACKDSLEFVSDITIPDGAVVAPDSTLDKRWQVRNSGECNWSETYRVRLIAGPELGAQKEQALYPARSGTQAVIRILFKAPLEPGPYRSAWQAYNAAGEPFGDPFFIDIQVGTP